MRALFLILLATPVFCQAVSAEAQEYFEKKVRPIFAARCQGCHNPKAGRAGLDLTTAAGFQKGADTGPIVAPGDPEKSRMLQVVGYLERIKMPPTGKISDEEIATLTAWVKMGAPWPAGAGEAAAATQRKKGYSRAQKEFWSFRPLTHPAVPEVKDAAWARNAMDRFVLAALEKKGLKPAPAADKLTLIRRATFDLTGLPPSEEEVRAFLADADPEAYARVIDRLLASPRYGEKWGRHWLDVARYADSTGADEDYRYPHAWRYRDYVVNAFNKDLPYDQFMRQQVAGDLLPPPPGQDVNTEGIIATGFLALGPKLVAEQDKVKMFYDIVDEQIDVAGKAFLGLTISCARCHDHKFDPISIKDYYSLASIFASTKQLAQIEGTVSKLYYVPLTGKDAAAKYEAHQKRLAAQQKEIDDLAAGEGRRFRDEQAPQIAAYMIAARHVYVDGWDAAKAAGNTLDAPRVEKWAAYLKPTKERRAHLERWYQASDFAAVAAAYQREFIAEAARRKAAQDAWKTAADAAKTRGEKAPPPPKFLAGDNRFYTEAAGAKGPLGLPEKEAEAFYTADVKQRMSDLKAELQRIKAAAPPEPPFACAVGEDQSIDQRVFLRGNPDSKGEPVAKQFPVVLAGEEQTAIRQGSGRLELANWLAGDKNPLPARVMANRLWQGHFGQGLVRSPNNFGFAGERPTHPELLDWLAAEFIRQGWSVKKMHRMMMLSSTYQMSAQATAEKREKDPDNRLLSRFPIRRKTVEEIRDSLLLIDGSLDLTMGGSLQKGEGTDNEFSDGRKSIHPDATNRRTIYLGLRRSNLATLFNLFDFGDATTSTETRSETNVAPQALYMMNSQFVADRTRGLAGQLLRTEAGDEQRIARAWITVLGHAPDAAAVRDGLQYIASFPAKTANDEGRLQAWSSFCRSLVASNDFIYIY
ncbi:MAG TPA: PSD1 and planctomycete cytochrome C domain-containing protein [Bryobacteraceae bacterium]|nr:PSD1 and planctomycete cytochrome C domain-containing protein [Bryobacteraceae bacterium]